MKVLICDDDEKTVLAIKEACEEMMKDIEILTYISSYELMQRIKKDLYDVDLFLLDVEMPGIDGFELRDLIDVYYEQSCVCFLTSHEEKMRQAFGRNVLGFLDKANYREGLYQILCRMVKKRSFDDRRTIRIETQGKVLNLDESMIIYVTANGNYTRVHFYAFSDYADGKRIIEKYECRKTLKSWKEELSSNSFANVKRNVLVNLRYIESIHDTVRMSDGAVFKLPVGKVKQFRNIQACYMQKEAGY